MAPPDVLAMRADFCLWFLCGRASVLKKRQPAGPAAAAAKKDSRWITSMADLAAFTGKRVGP